MHVVTRLVQTGLLLFAVSLGSVADVADVAGFLREHAYSSDNVSVLMAWEERAPNSAAEAEMVYGFRLAPRNGGEAFDVYFDAAGNELDSGALEELGIVPKDWTPRAVEKEAETVPGAPIAAMPQPIPKALPTDEVVLPPVNPAALAAEDDAAKAVQRIGVFQELGQPIRVSADGATDGAWRQTQEGGRVWSLTIRSLGALGQRIHFPVIRLPKGVRLIIFNTDRTEEVYGPFRSRQDFWTPTCFGEAVAVECYAGPGVSLDGLSLKIDRIVHNYKQPAFPKSAGSCNLDVACYEDWTTTSFGVAAYAFVGGTGSLACTGCLLADGDPDTTIPFFLTANHCISGTALADAMEVYWFYQRDACGGTVPDLSTVPRTTGGADFLQGSSYVSGTDFTLLRLRNAPPPGVTYLGFATVAAVVGNDVACVHHPSGDYKRISFGQITNNGSPIEGGRLRPIDRFHEVLWHMGTTEPGSSGSPLLLADTQLVIGQLYGGHASCEYTDEPDYFGRFDVTYPVAEPWLSRWSRIYDVDGSGIVNDADLEIVVSAALRRQVAYNADVDGSGAVDATDIQWVTRAVLSGGR